MAWPFVSPSWKRVERPRSARGRSPWRGTWPRAWASSACRACRWHGPRVRTVDGCRAFVGCGDRPGADMAEGAEGCKGHFSASGILLHLNSQSETHKRQCLCDDPAFWGSGGLVVDWCNYKGYFGGARGSLGFHARRRKNRVFPRKNAVFGLVVRGGFEPPRRVSKTPMLPLHHRTTSTPYYITRRNALPTTLVRAR